MTFHLLSLLIHGGALLMESVAGKWRVRTRHPARLWQFGSTDSRLSITRNHTIINSYRREGGTIQGSPRGFQLADVMKNTRQKRKQRPAVSAPSSTPEARGLQLGLGSERRHQQYI
ncbi:hypothetical protein BS47DRAFT_1361996 [Hydnum rufescens UP504]|uniref:Secreted protein n=1 Tax=Hydnum rufescens UP504 TaxID=1448309 RepID=A0A9P6AY63_9AGAM|nr:hypothetical protein BS47DRAFT_1361996 [Hydnum rufescens UP504]